MLRWLLSIVPKRFRVLSKLCLLVSGTHVVLLSFLFVSYKSQHAYALEIAKHLHITADSKIMFMPLYQTTKGLSRKTGGSGNRGSGRWTNEVPRRPQVKTARVKEKAATSLIADVTTKKSKKNGVGVGAKTKNKKNKTVVEKNKKKSENIEKKAAPAKEPEKVNEKKEPKKIETAPVPTSEQKPEFVHSANQAQQDVQGSGAVIGGAGKSGQAGQEDIVYVGQQEYDALGMQTYLQQELSTCWQPPQGIPADAVCEISFVVDWQGKATTVAVSKSSGALVYDISARSALLAMEFPEWARGKAFTITFKQ